MASSVKQVWQKYRTVRVAYYTLVVGLVAFLAYCIMGIRNASLLNEAMRQARLDRPNWQWTEEFETGGTAFVTDNLAMDIEKWQLDRGMTENFQGRFKHPAWYMGWNGWQSTYWTGVNADDTLINHHPNVTLPGLNYKLLIPFLQSKEADADLDLLRNWRYRPAGRFEHRIKGLGMLHLLPTVQKKRDIANLLMMNAYLYADAKNPSAALREVQTMQMLCRSFGDDPFIICQLVRMAINNHGAKVLQRVLANCDNADPKQLLELQNEYWAEAERNFLLPAFRGDRALLHHDLQLLEKDAAIRQKFRDSYLFSQLQINVTGIGRIDSVLRDIYLRYLFMPSSATWPRHQAEILQRGNAAVEAIKQPEETWLPFTRTLRNIKLSFLETLGFFALGHEKIILAALRNRTQMRAAATACAVERFRMEHQRWPTGWEEVIPKYLPAIPKDGMTGRPLIWKTFEDGIIIYGVGRDEVDSDGYVIEDANGGPKDDGIKLWSPGKRRMSPVSFMKWDNLPF